MRDFSAFVSFIASVLIIQLLISIYFYSIGLTDVYTLTLIPIGVIVVLTSDWFYLARKIGTSKSPSNKRGGLSFISKMKTPLKSSLVILVSFLVSFLLLQPQVTSLLNWIYHIFTQSVEEELLWRFVFSQNISAVISTLAALIVGSRS